MLDFTQYDKKSLAKVGNVDSSSVLVLEKDSILRLEKDAPSLRQNHEGKCERAFLLLRQPE